MTPYRTNSKPAGNRRFALLAAIFLIVIGGSCLYAFRHLGHWLELDEPLRPSTAIAVLGGGLPFRAMEAAKLYRAGWANEVWLTRGSSDQRELALAAIGLTASAEYESNRLVLEKLGVAAGSIRVIPGSVDNTVTELHAILHYARSRAPGPVILVSSKSHTRRLRVIWNRVAAPDRIAVVRYTPDDPFDPDGWWHNTSDALAAFRETFGILNAWTGFPIAPRERS